MTNEKKIAFIICANDIAYYNESVWYINNLYIPFGYEIDIICITEADSMAQGYNAGMRESDAKYKVYLHQDVFIFYKQFIDEILKIFQLHEEIGLIGMVGCTDLPEDASTCRAWNAGGVYEGRISEVCCLHSVQGSICGWAEVKAVDGLLMITQHDIEWREDLIQGWDFYDVSQSLEFLRKGYKVVIPYQEKPWCFHDCGHSDMTNYDDTRKKILVEYKDFFCGEFEPQYNIDFLFIQKKLFAIIRTYIERGMYEDALNVKSRIQNKEIKLNELQCALNVLDIYSAEKGIGNSVETFLNNVDTWDKIKNKYDMIKFIVRRVEREADGDAVKKLKMSLREGKISKEAIKVIIEHETFFIDKTLKSIGNNC